MVVTGNAAVASLCNPTSISRNCLSQQVQELVNNTSLGNLDLGWEKTTQFNYGIDFSMFNSRVSGCFRILY